MDNLERQGKNLGAYFGETIDIRAVLPHVEVAAQEHGWSAESFGHQGEFNLMALHRRSAGNSSFSKRIYLSSGIHGDEPAGPLAGLRLLQENNWPEDFELFFCPCLNPTGLLLNKRENADNIDLNRDYRNPQATETRAHIAWLERQSPFDLYLCLHEDWESHGFYVYEQNPDNRPSLAGNIVSAVSKVCPIDLSETIEGREAHDGIIRPNLDPKARPQWAEAFYLIVNKSRLGYTLEAPSDFPLETRVNALVSGVNAALSLFK